MLTFVFVQHVFEICSQYSGIHELFFSYVLQFRSLLFWVFPELLNIQYDAVQSNLLTQTPWHINHSTGCYRNADWLDILFIAILPFLIDTCFSYRSFFCSTALLLRDKVKKILRNIFVIKTETQDSCHKVEVVNHLWTGKIKLLC